MSKIAILGYGTIGSGVFEVVSMNRELIGKRAGEDVSVKRILDLRDFPGTAVEGLITHDVNDILTDDEIDVVVETMGGTNPAYSFVKQSLMAGKSVCTSNKELVEKHGPELLALAKEKNISFLFEASCGGGIPLIRPLITSYTADDIDEISGILNGTTNYILTKMSKEGSPYEEALSQAQQMGFAERNPEADVEGHDPCRKIAILSSLIFGKNIDFQKIYTEGITGISPEDIAYVNKMGCAIKLLASCRKVEGKHYAMVSPFILSSEHPLYSVNGVLNAVFIHGNAIGDTMLYGSGAGKLPTASAVVADVVEAIKGNAQTLSTVWEDEELSISGIDEDERSFFVRVGLEQLQEAKNVLGATEEISGVCPGEAAIITGRLSEKEFAEKVKGLDIISRIRMK